MPKKKQDYPDERWKKKKKFCVNFSIRGRLFPAELYFTVNSEVNFWDDL